MPDISAQIDELVRERSMRVRLYPQWVAAEKITQHQADTATAGLDAAIATLVHVRASGTIQESIYGPDEVPVAVRVKVADHVYEYELKKETASGG